MACDKCKQEKKCTCKKTVQICQQDGCEEKISTDCVIYKPKGGTSNLSCFLGLPSKVSATTIFEKLDSLLCNYFTLELSQCSRSYLGLSRMSNVKDVLVKLLEKLCDEGVEDVKVKVSETDNSSGYLADKITVGDCLIKTIKQDLAGNQTLELSIDFNCLKTKLPTCIEVDCNNCDGGQHCIDTTWTPTLNTRCFNNVSQIEEKSNCNNYRWVTGGNACQGTTFTALASKTFTKNNCPQGCTPSTFVYSVPVTSNVSQLDANNIANSIVVGIHPYSATFNTDGQNAANSNGVCSNCSSDCILMDSVTINF